MSAAHHTDPPMAQQPADTDVTHTSLYEAAHAYATHGVSIFPCRPHDKRPLGGNGFHDATTDPDQIERWWRAQPDANIGVALGANGVFALDVDGPDGRATLDQLEADHSPLPATYQVVTGRVEGSGRHHVYLQPAHGPLVRNHQIGRHLETRGDGGYIIAPPSIHPSGRPYLAMGRWSEIVHAPDWLIDLTYKPAPTLHTATALPAASAASRRLEAVCAKVVMAPEGTRNNILNWAAYRAGQSIGAHELDPDTAADMLLTAATRAGLNIDEATATIQSGMEAGHNDPDPTTPASNLDVPAVTTITQPADGTTAAPDDPLAGLEQLVAQEVARILARDRARELVAAQQLEQEPPPPLVRLDQFLEQPDPPITYRIDRLWPADGRCLLSAQYKAGKTTTVGNLLRCLVDGEPLFATYPVSIPDGRIVLFDDELHENTLRRWLRDQGIVNTERIHVVPLRGKLSSFNLLDDATRTRWADQIRAVDGAVVLLDCLRPIIDALGLSEDKDTGKVLTAFDELLDQASVSEGLIVHHMGHSGERSRGDSRLRDWPDAEWKLVREASEDGVDDPSAPRYFSAVGRDVEETEQRLALRDGRRLEIVGGSRKAMKNWERVSAVIQAVIDDPGIAKRSVPAAIGGNRSKALEAVDLAVRDGYIEAASGGGLNPCVPTVPKFPGNGGTAPNVTTLDDTKDTSVPPVPNPGNTPVPRPLKGRPGNGRDPDHMGTPPGASEVPL